MKFETQRNNTRSVNVNTGIWSLKLVSLGFVYNMNEESRKVKGESRKGESITTPN